MTPIELIAWRRAHNMKQTELAVALGVDRTAIVRWERGHSRTPFNIAARLASLAVAKIAGTKGQAVDVPEKVVPGTAKLRRDLALYESVLSSKSGRVYWKGPEHPCTLLGVPHPAPWGILESEEYLAALAAWRALPVRPLDPVAYPGAVPGETAQQWRDRHEK